MPNDDHAVRGLSALGARLSRAGYLRKWLILGAAIGVVAGLGAVVFLTALHLATRFFLGTLGGYVPPSPFGEGNSFGSGGHFARPWVIPLIVGIGGLMSGALVFGLAPEAEGHGTDAAISAVHHGPKGVRARVSAVKIVASAITIGSGGSGGREGPTAQISAGFGSMLARWLDLSPADARIAVTVGIGSGIGSIFRAPLGGAVLGAEILYRDDFEVEALIPSLVASIVGFTVFGLFEGFTPIFGFLRGYRFQHPLELVYDAAIGLAAGLVGILYARSFYGVSRWARRLPGARMVKPAAAGLLVGVLALALPGALGTGYGWVQRAMGAGLLALPLWVVLALPLAKILATSLSIGSGGSGGIFGPGMVIGGFTGAAVWRLVEHLPAVPHSPAPFVIVGMIACFGSIAHAPLAVMLMVAEMTGSLELLAPAMVAVGIATLVVGDRTIYASQLRTRAESAAQRLRFGLPLLGAVPVMEAMAPPRVVLSMDTPVGEAVAALAARNLQGAPLASADGVFRGSVDADEIVGRDPAEPVGPAADASAATVGSDQTLEIAVEVLADSGRNWVTVVDRRRRVVGVVATGDLVRAYRSSLEESLRSFAGALGGAVLVEEQVGEDSPVARRPISSGAWLPGAVVVTVSRGDQLLFPRADTVLEPGDVLSAVAPPGRADALRALIRGGLREAPESEIEPGPDLL